MKATAASAKELSTYYKEVKKDLEEKSQKTIDTINAEYEAAIKTAEGDEVKQLEEAKNKLIIQLSENRKSELLAIAKEEQEEQKKLREKELKDLKDNLDFQASEIEAFNKKIKKELEERGESGKGIIDVESTKKNVQKANEALGDYIKKLEEQKKAEEKFYDSKLELYETDSLEYKKVLFEKESATTKFNEAMDAAKKQQKKNEEIAAKAQSKYWEEVSNRIKEKSDEILKHVGELGEMLTSFLQFQLDDAKEKLEEISAKYDEVAEKKKESDDRVKDLEDKAKDTRGGALLVYQQQINEEMAKNKQLANQEKDLAKQKEKEEKEIAKKEKQMKKVELTQKIGQAIANVALGVTHALSFGPILGPILAAIIAVKGAIEIATMTKQLSKLEDGGLLRGKRHSEGGMRIEGTNIEVEGGEYVINRRSAKENLGLVNYINSQRRKLSPADLDAYFRSGEALGALATSRSLFADGGQLPATVNDANAGINAEQLVDAIRSIRIKPVVSVEDINHAQQNTVEVNSWIGM